MPSSLVSDVAIIGAGLGGTTLAIALHRQGIACRIYELRSEDSNLLASGVSLHVNGCKALDVIGVLPRITDQCFKVRSWAYVDESDKVVGNIPTGSEETYGYANHRVYRGILLDELRAMLKELGVPVYYNSQFEGIVEESPTGVKFTIDGRTEEASMLVGSDGTWSAVRKYITPANPEYTGTTVAYAHIPTNSVKWPFENFPRAVTLQGKSGSFFMIAEVADASELMVGAQFEYPNKTRAELDALMADKERVLDFFRKDYDSWNSTGQSIIDAVCAHKETASLWPFRKQATLDRWSPSMGRVVIIGDAAHSIPASSGQGVNQAIEDGYALSLLLGSAGPKTNLREMLQFWKDWRQTRIDDILLNMAVTDVSRLPKEKRDQMEKEGKFKDLPMSPEALNKLLHRIYSPATEKDMATWLRAHSGATNGETM